MVDAAHAETDKFNKKSLLVEEKFFKMYIEGNTTKSKFVEVAIITNQSAQGIQVISSALSILSSRSNRKCKTIDPKPAAMLAIVTKLATISLVAAVCSICGVYYK